MGPALRRLPAVLCVLLVVLGVAVSAACGGDDSTTPTPDPALQPYYSHLDSIFQKASDESAAANDQLQTSLSEAQGIEAEKASFNAFLSSTEDTFNTAISSMSALTVPADLQADHQAFVQAANSSKALAAQLQSALADVQTEEELQTLLNNFDSEKQPLLDASDEACMNLQTTAQEHGITIDLACVGG